MASGASKLVPTGMSSYFQYNQCNETPKLTCSADPEKVTVIRSVLPNIVTLSCPFLRFGHIKVGGRGTLVKLANDSLAVFSPVAFTPSVKAAISEHLGGASVAYLVALDQEHHIFLEQWHKEYPQAKVVMPETLPGLREKQSYFKIPEENSILMKKGKAGENYSVDSTFDSEFDVEYVDAHPNKEIVVNHKPTRTLIEADLLFNLPATEQYSKTGQSASSGFLTKLFISLNGTHGSAIWQKRLIWYGISSGNRKGYSASVAKIDKWDFDRIIPCHGDIIETGGKGIFEKVMEWQLKEAKKSS